MFSIPFSCLFLLFLFSFFFLFQLLLPFNLHCFHLCCLLDLVLSTVPQIQLQISHHLNLLFSSEPCPSAQHKSSLTCFAKWSVFLLLFFCYTAASARVYGTPGGSPPEHVWGNRGRILKCILPSILRPSGRECEYTDSRGRNVSNVCWTLIDSYSSSSSYHARTKW